ncbi:MAG: redox-sensing transcriptional repressor Rex [Christensenellaceae bacterium]|nr:redox-sensing transcriptional repressor Rex [Christensenellaceae bacterium]MBR3842633.1 redox-sensing transcriptional repressor Rex [Christensenellaceae bacterium]
MNCETNEMTNRVPEAVIRRLPKYLNYLRELEREGELKISSFKMSCDLELNASQIRRDLSYFGGFGQQGYGYTVSKLRQEIENILGINEQHTMVIAGAGNIGQALMLYPSFKAQGYEIRAAFDISPERVGKSYGGVEVFHMSKLRDYIRENEIEIGVIAAPKESAQTIANEMIEAGVRGIWNYAPTDVRSEAKVAIENVHLNDGLYVLTYKMKENLGE